MSTNSAPIYNQTSDPNANYTAPYVPPAPTLNTPAPQPKQGFWGVIKNRVLPGVGLMANRLAMMYGSPEVAAGAERGIQADAQQQELARQRAYDVSGLAEANARAAYLPTQLGQATELAQRQLNTTPASIQQLLAMEAEQQRIQNEYKPITGFVHGQPAIGTMTAPGEFTPMRAAPVAEPPAQIPTQGVNPSTPGVPEPLAQAGAPEVTPSLKLSPGPWQTDAQGRPYQTMYDQFGREVAPRPGMPGGMFAKTMPPPDLLQYFKAAGIDPMTATPEQRQQVLDAYHNTESSKTGIDYKQDINGNYVALPNPTTSSVRTHSVAGGGGSSASVPTPSGTSKKPQSRVLQAQPVMGPGGVPLHTPLSAGAKNTLFQVDSTLNLIGSPDDPKSLVSQLQSRAKDGTLWDAAKQRAAWEEYSRAGVLPDNIDPQMARLLPLIAQVQILGGMAYLKGIRNQKYIEQIQQHVPDPTKDSPQLMVSKINNLMQTLPLLKQAVYESEGAGPNAGPGVSGGGAAAPAVGGGFAAWKAAQGK